MLGRVTLLELRLAQLHAEFALLGWLLLQVARFAFYYVLGGHALTDHSPTPRAQHRLTLFRQMYDWELP